jgi:hypothetical protein
VHHLCGAINITATFFFDLPLASTAPLARMSLADFDADPSDTPHDNPDAAIVWEPRSLVECAKMQSFPYNGEEDSADFAKPQHTLAEDVEAFQNLPSNLNFAGPPFEGILVEPTPGESGIALLAALSRQYPGQQFVLLVSMIDALDAMAPGINKTDAKRYSAVRDPHRKRIAGDLLQEYYSTLHPVRNSAYLILRKLLCSTMVLGYTPARLKPACVFTG